MTAYQSWRAACATESLADITGADTDYGPTHSASEVMEETTVGGEGGPSLNLDDAGWLGGRSCPQLPNIVVRGASFQFDPQGRLCEFLGIGASLVLLFAYLQAARIIGG